ncbi:MAG TPA: Gfo/Idh/MocA family oxidoreductase, partial [Planctomycetota bacterium]|nr:Gfo/Idh/MocA family oxidoreductase [Planctomycetota bacterium]
MGYRAVLIGCGRMGSDMADDPRIQGITTHAASYRACSRTDLVAVCDADPNRAARCAERWKVPSVYSNLPDLLSQQRPE